MKRNYSNTATPQILQVSVGASDTVLTVPSTVSYPSPANPFTLSIDRGLSNEEVCLCTATTGTAFTVQRGYNGTTAVPHTSGTAVVEHSSAAIDVSEPNAFINTMTTKGDLLYQTAGGDSSQVGRLAVGTAGQFLGVTGGLPAWQTPPYPFSIQGINGVLAGTSPPFNAQCYEQTWNRNFSSDPFGNVVITFPQAFAHGLVKFHVELTWQSGLQNNWTLHPWVNAGSLSGYQCTLWNIGGGAVVSSTFSCMGSAIGW